MAKLTKEHVFQLKSLMKEDSWNALIAFLDIKITEWNSEQISGENEFQTLRALHLRQGKVEGAMEFFEELDRKAFE